MSEFDDLSFLSIPPTAHEPAAPADEAEPVLAPAPQPEAPTLAEQITAAARVIDELGFELVWASAAAGSADSHARDLAELAALEQGAAAAKKSGPAALAQYVGEFRPRRQQLIEVIAGRPALVAARDSLAAQLAAATAALSALDARQAALAAEAAEVARRRAAYAREASA